MSAPENSFFSRWSQRKVQARERPAVVDVAAVEAATALAAEPIGTALAPATRTEPQAPVPVAEVGAGVNKKNLPAAPTLTDAMRLTVDSDFTPFVARSVAPEVKNAALKTLFSDPHFNIMDGLDTYIDDYSQPDPLPAGMLRQMVQSKLLGLFDDNDKTALTDPAAPPPMPCTGPHPESDFARDENTALQLQPDPAPGRTGAALGVEQNAGRAH